MLFWDVSLQQTHGAFDIDTDGARINVVWRYEYATHWDAMSVVTIRIQNEL
jgi:hypothetical protein